MEEGAHPVNTNASETKDGRQVAPVYFVWNGEMMFDAPISDVWPHVINYPSWQNYTTVSHISGTPGREGEIVLLKKEEEGFEFPAYLARTVKLEPGRRVIWKCYPAGTSEGDEYFGFVDFRLDDVGGQTRFTYQSLYEFMVHYQQERELDEFRKAQEDNVSTLYASIYPKLRKLVEQGR
jgi:hypothetical protein